MQVASETDPLYSVCMFKAGIPLECAVWSLLLQEYKVDRISKILF